jgi:transposase
MLRMDQVHVIRHKVLVEGHSIRAVARQMGISRNTVSKYLKVSEPKRMVSQPKPSLVMETVAPRIEELLEHWRGRTTPKQRITGTRIHRQLLEEGYQVGITTVRDYLRERRRKRAEVFVPLVHRPGEEAQVDFFEVAVEEDGQMRKAWKFVMRLMYSGRDFRPAEGHDKGGVEARGKGIRLAHLTPIPKGKTLSEISEVLLREVEIAFTGEQSFAQERRHLRELPERPFEARRVEMISVSRRSTVRIEGATYSVPSQWASLRATAYIGVEDVRIHCRGQCEIYPRERKGSQKIRYRHYLAELAKKAQAVRQVAPELVQELGEPYSRLWEMLVERYGAKEASRVLARIVGALVDHGEEPVADALGAALENGRCDLLSLSERIHDPTQRPRTVEVPEALSGYRVESGRASDYDLLLLGNAGGGDAS